MDFSKELIKGLTVHSSLDQEVLVTTMDKLRLCLSHHQQVLTGRTSWIAPLGVLLTMTCVVVAADFKDALFLSKKAWETIFILGIGASALWLTIALYNAGQNAWAGWTKGINGTIDDIVIELKAKTNQTASLLSTTETNEADQKKPSS